MGKENSIDELETTIEDLRQYTTKRLDEIEADLKALPRLLNTAFQDHEDSAQERFKNINKRIDEIILRVF